MPTLQNVMRQSLKRAAITGGLELSNLAGRAGLLASARGRGAIFTLHHVRPKIEQSFDPNAHLEITPEFLDETIRFLAADGYQFVALHHLAARMAIARPEERFAAFTLDDGYRNNALHAQPIFTEHRVPFTVFITGGFACRTHSIWWETLAELLRALPHIEFDFGSGPVTLPLATNRHKEAAFARFSAFIHSSDETEAIKALDAAAKSNGIDPLLITERLVMREPELKSLVLNPLATLGAHTISHRALARLEEHEAREEMQASAERLECLTGVRPVAFAYPYGFNPTVSRREHHLAGELGFTVAVTTDPGTLDVRSFDTPMALPRISLNGLYQKRKYVSALASGIPFKLLRR
ncbi:peptidoglycan/xylan/chitin deacetylase (PgdA/CDA1 family) [Mycoplana sp. BE70]|uniref:polysaccharide deacetylase family protein n=1 Tax=Mycoplana sp. BE70 TaxID=2817775 RepID=UPI00286197D8|nr:polysaccharide deacetylase family protein [Mycoplana sp. BE70]MDR6756144.1 peptidoglycan/xylan/chitin deacetylase (PgdA/CDA1 family) [Mycoplana sp. BE70]